VVWQNHEPKVDQNKTQKRNSPCASIDDLFSSSLFLSSLFLSSFHPAPTDIGTLVAFSSEQGKKKEGKKKPGAD